MEFEIFDKGIGLRIGRVQTELYLRNIKENADQLLTFYLILIGFMLVGIDIRTYAFYLVLLNIEFGIYRAGGDNK